MNAASHRANASPPLMATTTMRKNRKPGRTWTGKPNKRKAGGDAMSGAYGRQCFLGAPAASLDSVAVRYVYAFDHKHRRPPMEYKDLLGGKGANLAEMTSVLKLPVPPGFTISTDACRAYMHDGWPAGLDEEVTKHVRKLEKAM